jgi:hypothetical protein
MKAQLLHLQWGRAFLTAVLVLILVIIFSAVLDWVAVHVWTQPDQQLMLKQFIIWSTFVLQLLLTVGGGLWLARNVKREPPLHGLIMGFFTALIFLSFSISFNVAALVVPISFVLTVAAGWLGGVLGNPKRQKKLEDGHFDAM